MDIKKLVQKRIREIGVKEAAKLFGVSLGTASNWETGKTSPSLDAVSVILPDIVSELTRDAPPAVVTDPDVAELAIWNGRKVHMMLPVYKSFNPKTHYSLFANYAKYGPEKIGMTMEWSTQIHVGRNMLAHKGLKTDAEVFITCDDDMIPPCGNSAIINGRFGGKIPEPGASMNAISRLMSHPDNFRIVGSLYFGRHRFGSAQCSLGFDAGWQSWNDTLRKHTEKQLIPCRWVAPGFMKIHRSVFEELAKAIDGGKFPECKPKAEGRPYGFFTPIHTDAGEDVSFGVRCAEIGIQSYLDPVLECLHVGDTSFGSFNTENKQSL